LVQLNAKVIIAVVVAFVLGVGAGGLVEHQRLKNKSNKAASSSTTTAHTGAAVRWFSPSTKACPGLKKFETSAVTAYGTLLKKSPWATTKAALLTQATATTSELKGLVPFASPAGKVGLNYLIARQAKTTSALQKAASLTDYQKAIQALTPPQVRTDNLIIKRSVTGCGGAKAKTTTTT
jgi:hypothetical protein